MVGIEPKITQRLINEGFVSETELQECKEIQSLCSNLGVKLSFHEILIHKFPKHFFYRQNYLEVLVHVLATDAICNIIDRHTIELGANSEAIFTDQQTHNPEFHKHLLANGIVFPKTYTGVLQNENVRSLQNIKIRRNSLDKWDINVSQMLQPIKNKQLMPLNSTLQKLIGKTIPFDLIERAQKLKEKIADKVDVPLVHILTKKYKIEPYFLHAIIISQARIENDKVELWLGGNFIASHDVDASTCREFRIAQEILRTFLETSFVMTCLNFRMEKEVMVVENIQKYASTEDWNTAIHIRKQLAQKKFPFSLLKIVTCKKIVAESRIFFEILKNVYNVPLKQAQDFTEKVYKGEKVEESESLPPLMNISLSSPSQSDTSYLEKTISLDNLNKGRPLKKAADKTDTSLDKTISRSHIKNNNSDENFTSLNKTITRSSTAERIRQRVLKAQQKQEDLSNLGIDGHLPEGSTSTIEAKVSKFSLMVRVALKKGYVGEDAVVKCTILQGDAASNYSGKKVIDILHEEKFLSFEQYEELTTGIANDLEVKLPILSKNMDLKISNELIEHNMVTREQVQKVFRVQRSLQHLFISMPIDQLLVKMKVVPSDIVEPVVTKIKQSLRKTVSSQELKLSNEPLKSQPQKSPAYSFSLVIFTILLLAISFYNFSSYYYDVQKEQSESKVTKSNTVKRPSPVKKDIKPQVVQNQPNQNVPREKKVDIKGIRLSQSQLNKVKNPNKGKYASSPIKLEKSRVVFLHRDSSYGLVISAILNMDTPPGANKLKVKFSLFDAFKNRSYKDDNIRTGNGEIKMILGPLLKPLCENVYYIKLSIEPHEQTRSIRRFYQLQKKQVWWIKYLHTNKGSGKNSIAESVAKERSRIAALGKRLLRQNQSFKKLLKRKPRSIRENYEGWRKKWQKTQDEINKALQPKYCIPVFAKTEEQLLVLNDYVNSKAETLRKWVTSFDLFPPQVNHYDWETKWSEFQQYLEQDQKLLKNIMSKL